MTKQEIEEKIRLAISNPVPKQVVDDYEMKEKELLLAFLHSQMDVDEFNSKIQKLGHITTIALYSPADLEFALRFLNILPSDIEIILKEQIPIYNYEVLRDRPTRFGIVVYNYPNGQLGVWVKNETWITRTLRQEVLQLATKRLERLKGKML